MPHTTLSGVFAAALTPLTADLAPDPAMLTTHARWLLDNGCHGVAVLGTTGEANSLSLAQRLVIIDAITAEIPADRLLIGTGTCALEDTVALTRAALARGCGNVLMLPTFYYKNQSDDAVYAGFAEVIDRVGDPDLRLYLYHFPQMSGTPIAAAVVARLIEAYPGIVVGLKDSSGDWDYTAALLRDFPGFAAFSGSERFLLDNLQLGGPGCISATTNVTAPLARKVHDLWAVNDTAAGSAQETLTAMRVAMQDYPVIAALKFLTARRTGDDAWLTSLPPQSTLPESRRAILLAQLEELGFFRATSGKPKR